MKKIILAGAALIVIVLLPLTQAQAGGYKSSPSIYFGISWGQPAYDRIWVPGYWERGRYGNWIWIEGYRDTRYKPRAVWVPGHWERRHGHRAWVAGFWDKKHERKAYRPPKKWKKRERHRRKPPRSNYWW